MRLPFGSANIEGPAARAELIARKRAWERMGTSDYAGIVICVSFPGVSLFQCSGLRSAIFAKRQRGYPYGLRLRDGDADCSGFTQIFQYRKTVSLGETGSIQARRRDVSGPGVSAAPLLLKTVVFGLGDRDDGAVARMEVHRYLMVNNLEILQIGGLGKLILAVHVDVIHQDVFILPD